ncbi:MAG: type IV conjugative transfer system protein TraL [Gammaproteobacteria bacterium RIFOXYB2_FULL_38_6]|nr:MAG: type IV conjugative transfer system protein TraL [Gammaproteobacteria bacterium RIFOXYB2_FULL_38_6]
MSDENKYFICRRIDEPKRYVSLTLDEFIPVIVLCAAGWFLGNLLIGIVLAFIAIVMIRHLKKGQGSRWLFNLLYWNLPMAKIKHTLFLKTPDSAKRHWLN